MKGYPAPLDKRIASKQMFHKSCEYEVSNYQRFSFSALCLLVPFVSAAFYCAQVIVFERSSLGLSRSLFHPKPGLSVI